MFCNIEDGTDDWSISREQSSPRGARSASRARNREFARHERIRDVMKLHFGRPVLRLSHSRPYSSILREDRSGQIEITRTNPDFAEALRVTSSREDEQSTRIGFGALPRSLLMTFPSGLR